MSAIIVIVNFSVHDVTNKIKLKFILKKKAQQVPLRSESNDFDSFVFFEKVRTF